MAIYIPSSGPATWQPLLAKPDLHWAVGYSARTIAHCWEAAGGLPREIGELLEPLVGPTELLLAVPEHKVALPGGTRESQCDVFALVRAPDRTIALAVEGKVDEPFGPTVQEWLVDASPGKRERLEFIQGALGLTEIPGEVRYQLLHRTAAAVVEAERFMTGAAAMVVHSFSQEGRWRDDFERFVGLFGAAGDRPSATTLPDGRPLYFGWAAGDQHFRGL